MKHHHGPAGSAYEIDIADHSNATVASWFLDCPGQSPLWQHYVLSIIHLRAEEGLPEPVIHVPHATHEVWLYALDPTQHPSLKITSSRVPMTPFNFVDQVQLPDDEAAVVMIESAVQAITMGILWAEPPLSGQLEPWRTAMIQTAAHLRGEAHGSPHHPE
jgi:hypothetical protein